MPIAGFVDFTKRRMEWNGGLHPGDEIEHLDLPVAALAALALTMAVIGLTTGRGNALAPQHVQQHRSTKQGVPWHSKQILPESPSL